MDGRDLFGAVPFWAIFVGTLLLALLSVEGGYRLAKSRQARAAHEGEQEKEAPVGAMVGATLGLLAFLLAITFGVAADAFQARKGALLEEANAIRTAWLRAELVDEPGRTETRRVLRAYVDERLRWGGVKDIPPGPSSRELLDRLWAQAAVVGQKKPGEDVTSLFVDSVNAVISFNAQRKTVRERSHIPGAYWLVLYLTAVLSLSAMGYHGGVAGTTRSPVMLAVALAFSMVIVVIADIDRPGEGWINVSQEAMIDLRDALDRAKP